MIYSQSAMIAKQASEEGNPVFWKVEEDTDIHVLLNCGYFSLMFRTLASSCDKNRARHLVFASLVLQQTLLYILNYEDSTPSVCFVIFPKFHFLTVLRKRGSLGNILKDTSGNFKEDNLCTSLRQCFEKQELKFKFLKPHINICLLSKECLLLDIFWSFFFSSTSLSDLTCIQEEVIFKNST